MKKLGYGLDEIYTLLPYERDIHTDMLIVDLKEKERRNRQNAQKQ